MICTKVLCVKVLRNSAEQMHTFLLENNFLAKNYKVVRDINYVYFPVTSKFTTDLEFVTLELQESKKIKNYKELLGIEKSIVPTSLDVVGNIAILKCQNAIKEYKIEIGNALLKVYKNLKSVYLTTGIYGEHRVRTLEYICGDNTTVTLHKEYGIKLKLDISKVYFSPRLANERFRIANLVKNNEVVIDMFAGIGSFSILIAKYKKIKKIYAIDINSHAIEYLKENIVLNKIENIVPIVGDAKEVINDLPYSDRIVMNLPLNSYEYFPYAYEKINKNGTIHYYEIINKEKLYERLEKLNQFKITYSLKILKHYSPTHVFISLDILCS